MLKVRVDDFPGTRVDEFYRHNLDTFKAFDAVMEKHGIEYVLGCIPRHTTQEHLEWLSQNQRIEVAMHGVDHDERFQNEFRDHQTKRDICQAIMSVKSIWDPLVGPVTTYIPPHNCIDTKTVDALHECGFDTILGGPGTEGIIFKHAVLKGMQTHLSFPDAGLYGRSDELLAFGACEKIRKHMSSSFVAYLTLHWTWEKNIGLQSLDQFLTELGPVPHGS